MRRLPFLLLACATLAVAQIRLTIVGPGQSLVLAVPDFRGDARTQPLMAAFNETLWGDLADSGFFRMAPKTQYPPIIPQQPGELRAGDWSANYLAMGYAAAQSDVLAVRAWLIDLGGPAVFEKRYGQSLDAAGARRAAHQYAADILASFGQPSLFGTHIYYVHETRPAPDRQTEIRRMDADGSNQRTIASGNAVFTRPAVSPDGARVAFAQIYPRPEIRVYSVDPPRALPFRNAGDLSVAGAPGFTPDGKHLLFPQSVKGRGMQLMVADPDGGNPHALTGIDTTDAEPQANPKTGAQIAFVSGRTGHAQIYIMESDGTGVERLSNGTGEAANPSWHPGGQFLAFAWTRGYASNGWNIFVINAASGAFDQLTQEGRNENPVWAPDGRHLVFQSSRSGRVQIWTMWADGSHLRQLTSEGSNAAPTWAK